MTDKVLEWIASDPDKDYYPVHYGDVVASANATSAKRCTQRKAASPTRSSGSTTRSPRSWPRSTRASSSRSSPTTAPAYASEEGQAGAQSADHLLRHRRVPGPAVVAPREREAERPARTWRTGSACTRSAPKASSRSSTRPPTTTPALPTRPCTHSRRTLRTYHRLGLRGVYICGLGGWKHLEHAYSYVDPADPVESGAGHGCAARRVLRRPGTAPPPNRCVSISNGSIPGAMQSRSNGVMDCHAGPGQAFFRELYTPEFVNKAYELFAQAEAQTADPVVPPTHCQGEVGHPVHGPVSARCQAGRGPACCCRRGRDAAAEPGGISQGFGIAADAPILQPALGHQPAQWHHYSLSSLVGFEPDRDQWWTDPRIQELMADPAAAFRKAQDLHQKRMERQQGGQEKGTKQ